MEIQAQDLLNAITEQRNRALDHSAELTAALLSANRRIAELEAPTEPPQAEPSE